MSVVSDVLGDARTVVNEVLGNDCTLTNTITLEKTPAMVVINKDVELYQQNQFAGTVTTGVFDLTNCQPQIGNELKDNETGLEYELAGIKTETPTKAEFILLEL